MLHHALGRRTLSAGLFTGLLGLPALTARATERRPGAGAALSSPTGPALLTISGQIRATNLDGKAVLDRAMLTSLGEASFTTQTPWYDRPTRFSGVPMAAVLDAVGAEGSTLTAIALNDYSTDIPVADFAQFPVLLATHRDGVQMRASDKGPLFIVYPYDSRPELRSRLYYSRSAWSVAQLIVR